MSIGRVPFRFGIGLRYNVGMEYEVVEYKGQAARKYPDGTIRNERGQALTLPGGLAKHAITSERASDMLRLRREKRARLATEGALRAVLDAELIVKYGDDAPLVERAQTLQTIASTPNAGKAAVMSAQYLDKLQGYADDPADTTGVVDSVTALVRELASFASTMIDVIPMRQEIEGESE